MSSIEFKKTAPPGVVFTVRAGPSRSEIVFDTSAPVPGRSTCSNLSIDEARMLRRMLKDAIREARS